MADVINQIFGSIQSQFIDPIGSGLWAIIGPVWVVAFVVALLALIFSSGPRRGAAAGALAFVLVFGWVFFNYGDRVVGAVTGNAQQQALEQPQQQAASDGQASGEGAASSLKAIAGGRA